MFYFSLIAKGIRIFGTMVLLAFLGVVAQAYAQTPAFPGAEGYGKFAKGGRGGQVIEVTNLNNSGSGSFRACLEASGPRTCIFKVGGTISLNSRIIITKPFLTVAGQTAPGGGITIRNSQSASNETSISIDADDVIIRYIRVRPGLTGNDAINVRNGAKNVIIDHVSASWSNDELISVNQDAHDFTLQWSLMAEPLNCAKSNKNRCHGYGSLMANSHSLSLHHNVWAHARARSPQIDTKTLGPVDVVNNVIYNAQGQSSSWGPSHIKDNNGPPEVNYINNYVKEGVDSIHNFYVSVSGGKPYLSGNLVPSGFSVINPSDKSYVVSSQHSIPQYAVITTTSAQQAFDNVLDDVGATRRLECDGTLVFRRDSVDARIVDDIRSGNGKIICNSFTGTEETSTFHGNCQEGVDFAYPLLASGDVCVDSDGDGMPNVWELANGFNPSNSSDGSNDADGNGYTNLEEYLNGTLSSSVPGDIEAPNSPVNLHFTSNQ